MSNEVKEKTEPLEVVEIQEEFTKLNEHGRGYVSPEYKNKRVRLAIIEVEDKNKKEK